MNRMIRRVSDVLLWLAVADRAELESGPNRKALRTASALGLCLAFTTLVSLVAGYFYAHDVWSVDQVGAIAFGLGFAGAVMSIDRFLISSVSGAESVRERIGMGLLRVVIAVILGVVVSVGVVLFTFRVEIARQVDQTHQRELERAATALAADKEVGDASLSALSGQVEDARRRLATPTASPDEITADPEVQRLQKKVDDLNALVAQNNQQVICEFDGTCGTGRPGAGAEWARKQAEWQRLGAERDAAQRDLGTVREQVRARLDQQGGALAAAAGPEVARLEAKLADLRQRRRDRDVRTKQAILQDNGLSARMVALGDLRHRHREVQDTFILMTLALLVIDLTPVLVKTLTAGRSEHDQEERRRSARRLQEEALDDEHAAAVRTVEREHDLDLLRDKQEHERQEQVIDLTTRGERAGRYRDLEDDLLEGYRERLGELLAALVDGTIAEDEERLLAGRDTAADMLRSNTFGLGELHRRLRSRASRRPGG